MAIEDFGGAAEVKLDANNQIKTVFEKLNKRPSDKRKRNRNNDPSDIEGFTGPWAAFVDEKRDIRPSQVCICIDEKINFFVLKKIHV